MNKRQRSKATPSADPSLLMSSHFEEQLILRKYLKQLSKLIYTRHDRIPVDELANLSCTVQPAISGMHFMLCQIQQCNYFQLFMSINSRIFCTLHLCN